ncbi:MAG TPA: cytochrome c-type biogenesis protein CcmH, partial [Bryobacteraceae bacterium]|nr:cytochrome c-type biogenesis protein CcmH [Bryobacteraceae bacterium]
ATRPDSETGQFCIPSGNQRGTTRSMMSRFRQLFLMFALAGVALSQAPSSLVTPEIRRVGDKLACKCGHCNNTVATCQMIGCGYSNPAREKIAALQKQGASDQSIIDGFVKEMGIVALAVPPTEGFHLLGWIMPFIAIGLGLAGILLYFKRYRRPAPAAVNAQTPAIDERYRKRIETEMAELD